MIQPYYPFSLIYMTETTRTSDTHQGTGTSPTMTNGQPIPEDVWQAILRLEAKRIRQADLMGKLGDYDRYSL